MIGLVCVCVLRSISSPTEVEVETNTHVHVHNPPASISSAEFFIRFPTTETRVDLDFPRDLFGPI